MFGVTSNDPSVGFAAGFTYVFNALAWRPLICPSDRQGARLRQRLPARP